MAIAIRRPPPGCIHHTDCGAQYCAHDYQKLLRKHAQTPKMLPNGVVGLGSRVKIESLSDKGRKLAFMIVGEGNDRENGRLGILSPLGQALIDAQESDEVEYQVGVEIRKARVL
jgi:transcription elongation GreA/GreB family factor